MGAWGTFPNESDSALDLFGEINDFVNQKLEKISIRCQKGKGDGYDFSGLIVLLLQKDFSIKSKYVEQALTYIQQELSETETSNERGWMDVEKAVNDMRFLIIEFEKLIQQNKELNQKLNDKNLREDSYEISTLGDFCLRKE